MEFENDMAFWNWANCCKNLFFNLSYFLKGNFVPRSNIWESPHYGNTPPLDNGFLSMWPLYLGCRISNQCRLNIQSLDIDDCTSNQRDDIFIKYAQTFFGFCNLNKVKFDIRDAKSFLWHPGASFFCSKCLDISH